jgi:hypothetical protein
VSGSGVAARSHHQIREVTPAIPKEPKNRRLFVRKKVIS